MPFELIDISAFLCSFWILRHHTSWLWCASVCVLRDNKVGLHEFIGDEVARCAAVSHAGLCEWILDGLDLHLLFKLQVELVEHLAERVRILEDWLNPCLPQGLILMLPLEFIEWIEFAEVQQRKILHKRLAVK